jgi:hypothetical protein
MKKFIAGFLFLVGFLLSPFSWWNDAFINVPLAYAMAIPLGRIFSKEIFPFIFVFMYVLTNALGIVLMRRSVSLKGKYTRRQMKMDVVMMAITTILIFVLVRIGIIPVPSYIASNFIVTGYIIFIHKQSYKIVH